MGQTVGGSTTYNVTADEQVQMPPEVVVCQTRVIQAMQILVETQARLKELERRAMIRLTQV